MIKQKNGEILKIVKITSRDRIIFPKISKEILGVEKGDHIAYISDGGPGIRVQKVSFDENISKK